MKGIINSGGNYSNIVPTTQQIFTISSSYSGVVVSAPHVC
jgi:hypothetical protein